MIKSTTVSILTIDQDWLIEQERLLVLLTVSWSTLDAELVSAVEKLRVVDGTVIRIDLDEAKSYETLTAHLPGLPLITTTPCVAVYHGGLLQAFTCGKYALAFANSGAFR